MLVVAADEGTRHVCFDAVRTLGCDVIEAADGREALVAALVRRPSMIVTESRLPIVSGVDLCTILRRDSQTRTVPIVAIASDAGSDADRIRRAGATAVLVKPLDVEVLLSEVRRVSQLDGADVIEQPLAHANGERTELAAVRPPRRQLRSRQHERYSTTNPPVPAPPLRCPVCNGELVYERSFLGGVNKAERWDDYVCPCCGGFEYRHRTRKLRALDPP